VERSRPAAGGRRTAIQGERPDAHHARDDHFTAIYDVVQIGPDRAKTPLKALSNIDGCQSHSTILSISERGHSAAAEEGRIPCRYGAIPNRAR
jgi:hypothetical protein